MRWDSSRPVPWDRLVKEWVVYAAIMTAVFLLFFSGDNVIGAIAGVLISGPLYLGFGAVLAKFGYTRKRLKDLRAEAKESKAKEPEEPEMSSGSGPRPRPAPTSRTSGGGQRPKSSKRRR